VQSFVPGFPDTPYDKQSGPDPSKYWNEKTNPDFWFPIPLPLMVPGTDIPIKGKLFSSRSPMDVMNGTPWTWHAKANNLQKVFVLTEPGEDVVIDNGSFKTEAGPWYAFQGIEMRRLPIVDEKLPTKEAAEATVRQLKQDLLNGNNCLVHCWSGNGRTGTILMGLYRLLGIQQPMAKLRSVRTTYLDNEMQEKFANSLFADDSPVVKPAAKVPGQPNQLAKSTLACPPPALASLSTKNAGS